MFPEIERFGKWLRCRSPHATTPVHYTSDVRLFFAWVEKPPDAIALRDVDAYIAHCRDLGHTGATVNRRLAALRCFFRFLDLETGDAPPNPVWPRRHAIRKGSRLPRDAKDADCREAVGCHRLSPRQGDLPDHVEVRPQSWRGTPAFPKRPLSRTGARLPTVRLGARKGDVWRTVYLSPQVVAALADWLAVRPAVESSALFLSRNGNRLFVSGIQERLARYCRQTGCGSPCHQLRHTFGRHMVEAAMPVTSIQRLLGHRRLRTTQTYLYLSNRQVQAEYDAAMTRVGEWLSAETDAQ